MTQQRITVIRGDGIGPDIIDATTKILDKVGCDFAYDLSLIHISEPTRLNYSSWRRLYFNQR